MTELMIERVEPSDFPSLIPLIRSRIRSFERLEQVDMLEEVLDAKEIPTDVAQTFRIWQARRGPHLVGAEIGHLEAGRWASIWGPYVESSAPPHTQQRLHRRIRQDLQPFGIRMLQAALPLDDRESLETLLALDFVPLARISALWLDLRVFAPKKPFTTAPLATNPLAVVSSGRRLTNTAPSPSPFAWRLIPCDSCQERELTRVMQETFTQSLDSPLLNSFRTIEDVTAGYRERGQLDSGLSFLVAQEDQNVGCLLLGHDPGTTHWRLLYLGLTPHVRGRGWGEQLVRWSTCLATSRGATTMSLEVDEANQPARQIYRRVGFVLRTRRQVLVQAATAGTEEGP